MVLRGLARFAPALKRKAQVQDIPGVQALDHRKKEEDAARAKIKERGQLRVGDGFLSESRKKEDEPQAALTKGDGAEKLSLTGEETELDY